MKQLKYLLKYVNKSQRTGLGLCCLALMTLNLPMVSAATSDNGQAYMDYNSAVSNIPAKMLAKKNDMRDRFPFNPALFDSKKVPKIARSEFTAQGLQAPSGGQVSGQFSPPANEGSSKVLTRQTGESSNSTTQGGAIEGNDFDYLGGQSGQ